MTLKTKHIPAPDFLASINQVIISLLPYNPTAERVAQALGCSMRTLQRRLEDSDADFSTLLLRIRREKAHWLLKNSDEKLTDIATALGYSSPSAFSRAFQQWEGLSPTDYRNRVLTE